jgi:hemoglobin
MEKSLYERLGGAPGIARIVEAHMNNPVINARFLPYRSQPERLAAVKQHTRNFLGAGSGGPEKYEGRDMRTAHRGMNVSAEEYMATIDDILATLEKHRIDEATRNDVLAIAYSLKPEILHA